jgi:hypothetical protein
MVSLIQIPESDDPAERARIPQWLKRPPKDRRRLVAWIAMTIALFIALPIIAGLGVFFDAENCGEILGSSLPWMCSSISRWIAGLSGMVLIMGFFMRWMIFVMRIYRYRDDRDVIGPEHPGKVDPYDPETW